MKFEYQDGKTYHPASIDKIGPVLIVSWHEGESVATMQACFNQANQATCAITKWEIDGMVKVYQVAGTNEDWPTFWTAFLAVMPPMLAEAVDSLEDEYKN